MNILYIAYSCSPNRGSEDRIGWKIPLTCAEKHKVFVITKAEHRAEIEAYTAQATEQRVEYFYVDIPARYKKIFRGFAYSGRLNIWHKRAVALAVQICRRENIDIIHQITPVEFRSIGDYGSIPGVQFVCGPVGGGEYIPAGLRYYARRHMAEEGFRAVLNRISLMRLRLGGILSRCDTLLFANEETKRYVSSSAGSGQVQTCMTEIGLDAREILCSRRQADREAPCHFLVAGRLIYRKGHEFLLDVLKKLPAELRYTCTILGSGPELDKLQKKCSRNGLDSCVQFREKVPFHEMTEIYRKTHVLIMPSIRETTGSVLLEAMSKGIPVVTIDRFGGAKLVEPSWGWTYNAETKNEFAEAMKTVLTECIGNPEDVYTRGQRAAKMCEKHTWEQKAADYVCIYERLIQKAGDRNEGSGIDCRSDL